MQLFSNQMKKPMRYLLKLNNLLFTGCISLFILAGCSGKEDDSKLAGEDSQTKGRQIEYAREVAFNDADGNQIAAIDAAIADEANERNEGLMDVNSLPDDKGMLFIFQEEQPLSFWMANTPLSLDIIFVNTDKKIVRIYQNTQPFTEKSFASGVPARYVVETNGGFCLSHDIQEGMYVGF